jgi:hypothetical protein
MVRHILRASKAWGLRLSEIISKHTRRDGGLRPFQVREEALFVSRALKVSRPDTHQVSVATASCYVI